MNKKVVALRGATCCKNTPEDITEYVCDMFNQMVLQNDLIAEDIISIQFTVTKEITKLNPAKALRSGDVKIDVSQIPLFCSQEAEIEGGMENVIRLLVTTYMNEYAPRKNIYLNGAERLRPDFVNKE